MSTWVHESCKFRQNLDTASFIKILVNKISFVYIWIQQVPFKLGHSKIHSNLDIASFVEKIDTARFIQIWT